MTAPPDGSPNPPRPLRGLARASLALSVQVSPHGRHVRSTMRGWCKCQRMPRRYIRRVLAATNGRQRRPTTALNARTPRGNLGYARPVRKLLARPVNVWNRRRSEAGPTRAVPLWQAPWRSWGLVGMRTGVSSIRGRHVSDMGSEKRTVGAGRTGRPDRRLGATLGATGANDLLRFRTDMNSRQECARGRGLI
jgi:hypothetical protein